MVSWNLAGIPAGELDTFVGIVSLHMMWDVMTIQEGFRKQEGLNSGGHELYTAPQLTKGNLRCPAILIHQRWAGQSTYLDGGTRWLAVSLWETATILSVHLPHSGCKISDYQDTLSESTRFPGEAAQRGALAGNGLQCQSCRSERQRSDRRSSDGEARENLLRAGERETSATGGVHGRGQLDGLQRVAEYRTFGVDVHTSSLERWTKSADRLHHGITRLVSPRHLDRPIHARSHGPQTCMRRIDEENLMWIQAQVHEETAKSSKLATGRQLDGEGQRNTERRWTGKLEGMGRKGQRNLHKKIAKTQREERIHFFCPCWLNSKHFPTPVPKNQSF